MPRELESIRWTIDVAASEFGIDRKTLTKRLKAEGIIQGDDGMFSTSNICKAMFSDDKAARTALAVSQKENYDLKNMKLAGQLADKDLFQKISDDVVIVLTQKISQAEIPQHIKDGILKDIQKIDVDELLKENPGTDEEDLGE